MNADVSHVPDDQLAGPPSDPGGRTHDGQPDRPRDAPLNRPVRWLVAAAEVLAAAVLVGLAVWAWQRASIPVRLPESDNPAVPEFTSRLSGPWVAAAFVAATAAGLLVLDALREAVLAARGRRPGSPPDAEEHE